MCRIIGQRFRVVEGEPFIASSLLSSVQAADDDSLEDETPKTDRALFGFLECLIFDRKPNGSHNSHRFYTRSRWAISAAIDPLVDSEALEKMCAGKEKYPSEAAARATIAIYRRNKLIRRAETLTPGVAAAMESNAETTS